MGMAIGVFIGVTPTIPFHTALLIPITVLFRQNVTAAYLGSWIISNPITVPVLYFVQYELGKNILRIAPYDFHFTGVSIQQIATMGWNIATPLLLGGVIMAPFFAVPAYFISYYAVLNLRKKLYRDNSKENTSK